jgi:hypothetical protein
MELQLPQLRWPTKWLTSRDGTHADPNRFHSRFQSLVSDRCLTRPAHTNPCRFRVSSPRGLRYRFPDRGYLPPFP